MYKLICITKFKHSTNDNPPTHYIVKITDIGNIKIVYYINNEGKICDTILKDCEFGNSHITYRIKELTKKLKTLLAIKLLKDINV